MIALTFDNTTFKATQATLLAQARNPEALLLGQGREAGNVLKKHFRQRDRTNPSALGTAAGRREHFWLKVASSVNQPATDGPRTVSVAISDPRIAQKVFGGTIVAKRAQRLAIPVSPDAYGRSPGTFERETGLKLFVLKQGGTKANTRTLIILAAARGQGIEVHYVLKRSVRQQPDPQALPPEAQMEAAVLARGETILQRQLAQLGGNT